MSGLARPPEGGARTPGSPHGPAAVIRMAFPHSAGSGDAKCGDWLLQAAVVLMALKPAPGDAERVTMGPRNFTQG